VKPSISTSTTGWSPAAKLSSSTNASIRFLAGRAPSTEELDSLHHRAHDECFIANSLKCEIVVEPGP
jgi:organic hydroperoxide reductase OsmC/OhrA